MRIKFAYTILVLEAITSGCQPMRQTTSHRSNASVSSPAGDASKEVIQLEKHSHMPNNVTNPRVIHVVQLLNDCPAWAQPVAISSHTRLEIISYLKMIAEEDTDIIHAAERVFYDNTIKYPQIDGGTANMSKLFVLNRYLFNIPNFISTEQGAPSRFGFIDTSYIKGSSHNSIWPLSVSKSGVLELAGTYQGYSGPGYSFEDEFLFFRKVYGRRKVRRADL